MFQIVIGIVAYLSTRTCVTKLSIITSNCQTFNVHIVEYLQCNIMVDTKETIIQKFNMELGNDLEGLNKIYEFHQSLNAQKNEIEKSVCI